MSFEKLNAYFETLPSLGVPAAEVIVTRRHEKLFHALVGYSDAEKKAPTSERDLYYLYSSSKVLTCAAGLCLAEDGKLDLDAPVSKYIPEFANLTLQKEGDTVPTENTMLVRHLFTMTGGLSYDLNMPPVSEEIKRNPNADTLTLVRAMAKAPLLFEPGTYYQYSLCHDVLAAAIEVASGMRFSEYVNKRIAEPLGMDDLHFHVADKGVKERITAMYTHDEHHVPSLIPTHNVYIFTPAYESGGAGVITTTSCYIKFVDALANGGVGANGARILSEKSIVEMSRNHLNDEQMKGYHFPGPGNYGYGYGLGVRTLLSQSDRGNMSRSSIGEFGWGGAAGTYVLVDPKENLAIYYSQQVLNMCYPYATHPHNVIRDLTYEALGL